MKQCFQSFVSKRISRWTFPAVYIQSLTYWCSFHISKLSKNTLTSIKGTITPFIRFRNWNLLSITIPSFFMQVKWIHFLQNSIEIFTAIQNPNTGLHLEKYIHNETLANSSLLTEITPINNAPKIPLKNVQSVFFSPQTKAQCILQMWSLNCFLSAYIFFL